MFSSIVRNVFGFKAQHVLHPQDLRIPALSAKAIQPMYQMRLYSSEAEFSSKMSDKRNILDHKRRLLAAKYELRRNLYKALCRDPDLPKDMQDKHRYKLNKLPRNSAFSRVRNRCIFSGRSRSVFALFRMSRIVFRGLASRGALMGIKKSSW